MDKLGSRQNYCPQALTIDFLILVYKYRDPREVLVRRSDLTFELFCDRSKETGDLYLITREQQEHWSTRPQEKCFLITIPSQTPREILCLSILSVIDQSWVGIFWTIFNNNTFNNSLVKHLKYISVGCLIHIKSMLFWYIHVHGVTALESLHTLY